MFIKLVITILIIINLNVPFNSIIDIGLLGLLFTFLISTKINQSTKELILTKQNKTFINFISDYHKYFFT